METCPAFFVFRCSPLLLRRDVDERNHDREKRAKRDDSLRVHGQHLLSEWSAQEAEHRSRDSISQENQTANNWVVGSRVGASRRWKNRPSHGGRFWKLDATVNRKPKLETRGKEPKWCLTPCVILARKKETTHRISVICKSTKKLACPNQERVPAPDPPPIRAKKNGQPPKGGCLFFLVKGGESSGSKRRILGKFRH